MITLSSGVIWGLTFRLSVALRNETLVAPLLVACWYGISVPCSISASMLSPVMTRGLEMILPSPVCLQSRDLQVHEAREGRIEQANRELAAAGYR